MNKQTVNYLIEEVYNSMTWNDKRTPFTRKNPKINRNDKCPCGSNKKYKKCCLRKETNV